MDIFESLENLNVSEECFDEIMELVEEVINELYPASPKNVKALLKDRKKKEDEALKKVRKAHDQVNAAKKTYQKSKDKIYNEWGNDTIKANTLMKKGTGKTAAGLSMADSTVHYSRSNDDYKGDAMKNMIKGQEDYNKGHNLMNKAEGKLKKGKAELKNLKNQIEGAEKEAEIKNAEFNTAFQKSGRAHDLARAHYAVKANNQMKDGKFVVKDKYSGT